MEKESEKLKFGKFWRKGQGQLGLFLRGLMKC